MPWTPGKPFSQSGHNRRATGRVGVKATAVANAVLRRSGDDVLAMRVANKYVKTHGKNRGLINRGKR